MARSRAVRAAATLVIPLVLLFVPGHATAAPQSSDQDAGRIITGLRHTDYRFDGRRIEVPNAAEASRSDEPARIPPAATPAVGTVRQWLGLDDTKQNVYRKDYTLRGVGKKIEVWVANDRAFPAGDCRNQIPGSTDITDAQVNELISEFDNNMYPKETATFSTPKDRDGTHATYEPDANGNGGVYTGDGDKTVALLDNVRDANYYNFPAERTYLGGFYMPAFNQEFDRNVMTIDVFDWQHRTTATPPNEPTDDPCTSRPARPFSYESTFAHEWQHLLLDYIDGTSEDTWLNEGMSDFAQTLTGYVDSKATVDDQAQDGHLTCFQGFATVKTDANPNPRECGGPENSLNLWEGGRNASVLADYGNAYQFMLYLYDHYGADIISRLHRDAEHHGLDSVATQLKAVGENDLAKVLHNYQTSVLVDRFVENGKMFGADGKKVTSASVRSTVNLANPAANATPGAAPNGADYVQLQGPGGTVLKGRDLTSLTFEGAKVLPSLPLTWTVVSNDPDRADNPVLFSGNEGNLNSAAITPVTVPTTDPTLRFLAKYGAEEGYDYAYVTVSTDGGATYKPIAGDKTVDGPLGPGLTGKTTGFEARSYDLSAYAGQNVLLGLQYVSDPGVNEGGLLVDDVTIGGTTISDGSNVTPFKSPTQIKQTPVNNWNLRLVGLDEQKNTALQKEFNGTSSVQINRYQLAQFSAFPKVVAIVTYDEPTGKLSQYAPYQLTANGVVQPGG
ncbi:immune inhibitor A [Kibdelosporangium philippinense]|uniref:Immune inhibitor A n=1 Tax=Kibdelosporangium philippinense TaxID=211113 RepID=A0ABS8Z4H3_9PSEU|nr:immune inhibitor A domain-containing protein [Kibdelosporangium philippinense]MCE7001918.1 immune inhibitor A [Kibdelosporangium philippinense]